MTIRHSLIGILLITLGLSGSAHAQFEENPERFLGIMNQYLALSGQFVDIADNPANTIHIAIEGIVELYEERGQKAKAADHLEKILEQYSDNQTVRNLIRFKLRDVYKESGRSDLAMKQLELIIKENQ